MLSSRNDDQRDMEIRQVLIYGCGGHGRVILDILRARHGQSLSAVFVDDNPQREGRWVDGIRVHGPSTLRELLRQRFAAIAGVGDNLVRARLYLELRDMGFVPATAVHPSAVVSRRAWLGPGVALMPGVIVSTGARVEENACINTAASVDHDCLIGPHAHVFPGARLTGNVAVGGYATIGTGACLAPGVRVGRNAVIGAGAVVLGDIPDNAVAYGVPARLIRFRDPVPAEEGVLCGS